MDPVPEHCMGCAIARDVRAAHNLPSGVQVVLGDAELPAGGGVMAVLARFGVGEDALVDFAERASRNEEIFRDVNEKIDEGAERHGVASAVPYHCECGSATCFETVELRPSEYGRVASER